MTVPELAGVLPVVSTPFASDWRIDEATLRREIDWLLGMGAHGAVTGMVSEILRLRFDERKQLGEVLVDAINGRGASVLSVGGESTDQAVELASHARDIGATAIMANPPLLTATDSPALLDYFRSIADASDDMPLVVQDASGYLGEPIPISVLADLFEIYGPTKIQFKPEAQPLGPRQSSLLTATSEHARIFEGSGGLALVDSHGRGAVGTMPGPDLIWAIVRLWNALENGESEVADLVSARVAAVLAHVSTLDSYIAVEKFLLVKQRVLVSARQRGPTGYSLDAATSRELLRLVDHISVSVGEFVETGWRHA